MLFKQLKVCDHTYTYLQLKELSAAKENGLCEEHLKLLTSENFNYLQLKTLRSLMEQGLSIVETEKIAKKNLSYEEMEEYGKLLLEHKDIDVPVGRIQIRVGYLCIPVVLFLLIGMAIANGTKKEPLFVHLSSDKITLGCGEKFEPMDYLEDYSMVEDAQLILPEAFVEEMPCTRIASYELYADGQFVRKVLTILVEDKTKPVISLSKSRYELLEGAPFSCRAFIESAEDNIDGNLTNEVKCSSDLTDDEEQTVLYKVKDHAGNETIEQLQIHRIPVLEETVFTPVEPKKKEQPPQEPKTEEIPQQSYEPVVIQEEIVESYFQEIIEQETVVSFS